MIGRIVSLIFLCLRVFLPSLVAVAQGGGAESVPAWYYEASKSLV